MSTSLPVSASAQNSTQFTAGGGAVTGLKPANRTFSLTGVLGSAVVSGDAVELWGSNDGGVSYQPLRTAATKNVVLTFGSPETVINDCCDHYATRRVSVGVGSTLAAVGMNGEATGINASPAWVQGGNAFGATGVLGTTDANPLSIIAESQEILMSTGTLSRFGSALAGAGTLIEGGNSGLILSAQNGSGNGNVVLLPGVGGTVRLEPGEPGAGNTAHLQFVELLANGTNSVGFKAPDAIAVDVMWVLPNADATLANKALVSDGAGNLSFANAIQSGAADLANGVSAAIAANISATSRIFIQAADVVPGAGNLTIDYRPLGADRVNGTPGSFKITAVLAAGTINALDQSQGIMWMVLNA